MDYREVLRTDIQISSANTVVAIPIEDRIEVHKLAVQQTAGAAQNFTLDLFNRHPAELPAGTHENLFRICPQQSVANGSLLVFFNPMLLVGLPAARPAQGTILPVQSPLRWHIFARFNGTPTGTYALLLAYRKRGTGD